MLKSLRNRTLYAGMIGGFVSQLLSLLAVVPASCRASDGANLELPPFVEAYAAARDLHGTVLVAQGDHVLFHRAYGLANREWGIPNRPDTRYLVASVTKPFTAMAILSLVEQGLLRLEGRLDEYLPDYRPDTGSQVTLHHLLTHTSGIPNFANREFYVGSAARLDYDRWDFVKAHCSGDLLFPPGSESQYSDANYVLLATVVESVTGLGFGEVLRQQVFQPAGMNQSTVMSRRDVHTGLASSYVMQGAGHKRPDPINYADVQRGAGDMITTANDVFRGLRALRRGDVLSAESRALLFEPHATSGFNGLFNGHGWNLGSQELQDGREFEVFHAPGNNGGYNAIVYLLPESDHLVIIFLNAGTPWLDARLFDLGESIVRLLHGEPVPLPRPSIEPLLREALEGAKHEELVALHRGLRAGGLFDVDEPAVNRLGYALIREGRFEQAVTVLELNVEAVPTSANAHDSLGEAYWTAGRLKEARVSYQRSLELNPDNTNAVRMTRFIEKKLDRDRVQEGS